VLHALPVSSSLTWSLKLYLATNRSYERRTVSCFSTYSGAGREVPC
jgi:hypothetical protein